MVPRRPAGRVAWRGVRARVAIGLTLAAIAAGCGGDAPPAAGGDGNPFRAEVRTAGVAGTEVAWYERGAGEPLVMLTGTGSTMAEWDPALLRLLAREHRLLLLDYPGLGRSGPWRDSSFDSLADVVDAWLEEIGVSRAAVLGWSMGGFVAQRLAVRRPERVEALILAGTNPGGSAAVLGTPRAQRIDSDPDPATAEILSLLYPRDRRAEGRRFLRRLRAAGRSGEIPDDFRVPDRTVDRQVAAEGPWLRSDRNARQLRRLELPLLAAAGRRDPVTPPLNMRRIASFAPRGELTVLPGAHAFPFQSRRAFADSIGRFLARDR